MLTIPFLFAVAFHALGAFSQTITHITEISMFSDLPSCLTNAVDQIYEALRTSECPQTNFASAASCICRKTANSAGISFSMSVLVPIWCAAQGGDQAGLKENFSSGLAVFSQFCTEAGAAGPAATATKKIPVETGAGQTTGAPASGTTSTNSDNQNNPPASSSSPASSPGLSLGEKLAIGVTIPATLAAIVGCYFAWRQHQRGKKESEMRKAAYQQAQIRPDHPPTYQLVQRYAH